MSDKFWKFRFVLLLAFVVIIAIYSLKIETKDSTYITPTPTPYVEYGEPTPEPTAEPIIQIIDLGEFRYTYYTNSIADTGKVDGITFSGVKAVEGITIAADLSVIPMGSWVYIEGYGVRKVQDKGSAVVGKIIDIYVDEKSDKLVGKGQVYLLGGEEQND